MRARAPARVYESEGRTRPPPLGVIRLLVFSYYHLMGWRITPSSAAARAAAGGFLARGPRHGEVVPYGAGCGASAYDGARGPAGAPRSFMCFSLLSSTRHLLDMRCRQSMRGHGGLTYGIFIPVGEVVTVLSGDVH